MARRRRVSIREIADLVGVHVSTVSRALNPATRHLISTEIRQRIAAAADELGYRHNRLARSLRVSQSMMIGVLIPDLTNPVFPPIVRGIESTLSSEGYITILADTFSSPATELAIVDTLHSQSVDGLIMATAHRKDEAVNYCRENDIPFVLVNRTVNNGDVRAVVNDEAFGISSAVRHLTELGHTALAFVGGPLDTSTGHERHEAFLRYAREAKLQIDNSRIAICHEFSENAGRSALNSLLARSKSSVTAVVAANDRLALGCYDALADADLKCPGDIAIVGYNDMALVDRVNPPLTTVRIAHAELGSTAARLLLETLRDPSTSEQGKVVRLRPSLIVRGSTGKAPKRRREKSSN